MSAGSATDRPAGASALRLAAEAARACGVTRLGEITHLDRLGVPVFHAVRPWTRALSVHQGKGLCPDEARLGALMEAVESAHAEAFDAPTRWSPWADLPPDERPLRADDFAARRGDAPAGDEAIAWVAARRILDGGRLWVPFDAVSLDFSRPADPRLAKNSTGQAAHVSREAAVSAALLEVLERDAVALWLGGSATRRARATLAQETIPFSWWRTLRARIDAAGLRIRLYALPALAGCPALLAELRDVEAVGRPGVYGAACHSRPEQALRAAVLEAVQSRVTEIAGARDDILYDAPGRAPGPGLAWPSAPGLALRRWHDLPAAANDEDLDAPALARRLADAGYPQSAVIDLPGPSSQIAVVKAFVPGLGANGRLRRRPGIRP